MVAASGLEFERATALGWTAVVGTAVSALLGLIALIGGRGRRTGALAVVVSAVANPVILTALLACLGDAAASGITAAIIAA